ncbi:SusD-like starch-binding protein associating with outer membrane [Chitinophaga polysaccharea]|uniref:SusD-like starch-binding protein associating with outer membrane n=1 Tax=Chitinophaga polysaccharea TaxID=1293035 RepID=A0A561P9W7_9BACT|nr:RagB/SusD family nutrient uptake outer membrane protein [Chitinophaga polysaccharea]TWF34933.1 SusD-like starch-binding protein associating with outer membrane [Chitinophaga polysaccharea]
MKKYKFYLPVLLLILASCNKKFLDLTPVSTIAPGQFFKTASDAVTAVNGCYASLAQGSQYGATFEVLMEARADNFTDQDPSSNAGQNYQINRYSDNPGNTNFYNAWVGVYNGIFRCNTLLTAIDGINMDESLKNRIKGEARFIRALSYFNLVRLWGPVPLLTAAVDPVQAATLKRDDVAAVYKQVEEDLVFAAANLPATYAATDLGRVTSGAAKGLLGKVYLYQKKYTAAQTVLQEVIDSKAFTLLPKVADVFSTSNKYNAEILFAVRYAKGVANQDHGFWYANSQTITVDTTLLKAYNAADLRRPLSESVKPTGNANMMPRKFVDDPVNGNAGNDFPVLRFADVLLMQAEVLNEVGYSTGGNAFTYLNMIRTRAGLSTLSATDLPDQTSFRNEIYLQRRLELPFECDRWFDLVRSNRAITEILANKKVVLPSFRLIYPIPQQEIDIMNNKATFPQNQGYD